MAEMINARKREMENHLESIGIKESMRQPHPGLAVTCMDPQPLPLRKISSTVPPSAAWGQLYKSIVKVMYRPSLILRRLTFVKIVYNN